MRNSKVKTKQEFVIKYVIEIYLLGKKKCIFKSVPLDMDEVDQVYAEICDNKPVMEFGDFYFNKTQFNYALVKSVKVIN